MSGTDNQVRNAMYPGKPKPHGKPKVIAPPWTRGGAIAAAKKSSNSRQIAETLRNFAIVALQERGDELVKSGEVVSDDGGCIAYMKWLSTHPKWTPCFINLLSRLTPPLKEVEISGSVSLTDVVTASYKRLGIEAPGKPELPAP